MNPHEYLRLQLRLEGKEIVHENLLRQVEDVPGEDLPLMIITLFANGKQVAYYAETLPTVLLEELIVCSSAVRFPRIGSLLQFWSSLGISVGVGHYKTYTFPKQDTGFISEDVRKYSPSDPLIGAFGFDGLAEPVFAIERDGKIVSACVSTRENQFCGEAWVCTDPGYRRQGLARNVVRAWAQSLIAANKVPFYSHDIENTISAKLAKCLELQPVFEEIVISNMNV